MMTPVEGKRSKRLGQLGRNTPRREAWDRLGRVPRAAFSASMSDLQPKSGVMGSRTLAALPPRSRHPKRMCTPMPAHRQEKLIKRAAQEALTSGYQDAFTSNARRIFSSRSAPALTRAQSSW
eukprot:1879565-Rhodomonas_salina.1